jgi:hypothetical protein
MIVHSEKVGKPKVVKGPAMGAIMPIGEYKGEYIANVPDDKLVKLWKFSRRLLSPHADAFEEIKMRVG